MALSDADILRELTKILAEDFEVAAEAIKPEAHLFTDLGLDSIDAVDLAVKVQTLTGKRIKAEDFKTVRTVGDVVAAARKLLAD